MISLLVSLLITLLILGVIYWVGTILLSWIAAPAPLVQIFQVVFVVVCLIVLIYFLMHVFGVAPMWAGGRW